ncbi:single-stranded-DNA-specific exonuclease RecJ [Candidatus Uhrbacteria bacterium]|jgi:single-stranded-DNA-specific exonuclease|nr:single-stranded-DNA-specific exonuclease RecJ [Candidatus Uhrbacteria bacterium]MBT7717292.1 single-stranded-DNA-specific exonuclease RecJ [Candidatus Uhrbacteria bacterium]
MKYTWKLQEKAGDSLIDQLLFNRDIDDEHKEAFLNPDWDRDIHDPFLFTKMQQAVERAFTAIEKGQKIVIHGDYDADGICGSSIIFDVLQVLSVAMGAVLNVEAFLPHRERDGYGVAMHTIERLDEQDVELLITVDCGIANAKELNRADEAGIDVIICDHHQLASEIPEKALIIHPLAPGETYPNKKLAGSGVAFKFACALLVEARKRGLAVPQGHEKWLLDLVAIATVTDVVPLTGENRVLEKFGLVVLNKTRRPGLLKIIENAKLELGSINTTDIGYRIGPRINASGRIREAKIAFDAINAMDANEATKFALELEMINRERQRLSDAAYKEARVLIDLDRHVHVIWDQTWAPGIVGLVAGKIAHETNTSTFALTISGDQYVGSGRSARGLHLVEAMHSCGDIFVKAGGHPEACGLTFESLEMVELFKIKVNEFAKDRLALAEEMQELLIDSEVSFEDIDWALHEQVEKFAPFGKGNSEPIFSLMNVRVASVKVIGQTGKHLKLRVGSEARSIDCIGFGFGDLGTSLKIGSNIDLAFKIGVNEWNGQRNLQLIIEDIVIK